jgi:hypothetical protein
MTREKIWTFFAKSIERLQILDFFISDSSIVNSFFLIRGHDQAIEADDVVGSCGFSLLVLHAMARYTIIQNHLQTCLNNIYIVRQQPWSWTP